MFRILDGRDAFYQWDLNRQVIVEDNTVNTVHFCNCLQEETLVTEVYEIDGVRVADVPNILLQEAWDLKVYGFCGGKYTKVCNTFAVLPKNKPASYIYEETDVLNWDNLKQEFEELDANTAASLDALAKEIEDNLEAMDEVVDAGVRVQGKIIYINLEFSRETSLDRAKEIANETLNKFSDEEKSFYDFGYFLTQVPVEENSDKGFVVTGSKNSKLETISWIKS